jgi:hypothetical protein
MRRTLLVIVLIGTNHQTKDLLPGVQTNSGPDLRNESRRETGESLTIIERWPVLIPPQLNIRAEK